MDSRLLSPSFVSHFRMFKTPQGKKTFVETSITNAKLLLLDYEAALLKCAQIAGRAVSYPEVCSIRAEIGEMEKLWIQLDS